ncbi:MAG: hypothetical protein AAFQ17_01260, partial [Pseudomonadota bacterium]
VKANPVDEIPIGTHPVRKNVVFCRLFNISLSARAYFQLHAEPSLDASSNEMLAKVAQWYIDTPEKVRDPDSAYWAGEYHSVVLAKFGSRGTERPGAVSRETERLLLEYMLSYVNHWSRLDHYEASLKYETYYYWSTENHWWQEIVASWGYLLALKDDPEFRDRKLDDGRSIQEHYDRTSAYMIQHMQQRARKGFLLEISSGGYSSRMHNMWYAIYDISPDERMRKLARNTLDLYWAFWAEEHIAGERGGGKVRHRGLRGLVPRTERHLIPAWLFFGAGTHGMEHIRQIDSDTTELAMHYMVLFSGYLPDEAIYRILDDRATAPPYAIIQRRQGKEVADDRVPEIAAMGGGLYDVDSGDCLKYSWVTPDYILGTVMRPPHDGYVWNRGAAQGWWHGLIISSGRADVAPERVVPTFILDRDISSDQYALQSGGSLMTRKIPDEVWGKKNAEIPMGVFISSGLRTRVEHADDFLFIEDSRCWVAVRAVDTQFVLSNETLLKKHQGKGDFYKLENDHQPLIIEVATPGDFASFDEFKAAARAAGLDSSGGVHAYDALSGDRMVMHDDRSAPTINGAPVDYNPGVVYQSRYVYSDWDSGVVTLSAGETTTVLDFMSP